MLQKKKKEEDDLQCIVVQSTSLGLKISMVPYLLSSCSDFAYKNFNTPLDIRNKWEWLSCIEIDHLFNSTKNYKKKRKRWDTETCQGEKAERVTDWNENSKSL